MSVFNEPINYIKEALDSIVNQTFDNFECIIVLDKPDRDDVDEVVKSYDDKRLKLYKNSHNIGLAMSMNYAASVAAADIFARMDADDIADLKRLEVEYNIINSKNVDLVFSGFTYIDENSVVLNDRVIKQYDEGVVNPFDIAIKPSQIHHPTVMMRRDIFEKVGGYRDFPCAQDTDLWMRMQESGAVFYRHEEPLLKYRVNPLSTTRMKYFRQQLTAHYIYSLSLERLETGKDSYSLENYNNYMVKHGLNSKCKNKLFGLGLWFLRKAKKTHSPFNKMLRLNAFLFVPQLSRYYVMETKKKRILKQS